MPVWLQVLFAVVGALAAIAGIVARWDKISPRLAELARRLNDFRRTLSFTGTGHYFVPIVAFIVAVITPAVMLYFFVDGRRPAPLELPDNVREHFLAFFKARQAESGGWSHATTTNASAELAYTAQVLSALAELGVSPSYKAEVVQPAVESLVAARTGSPLLDVFVRSDALFLWRDLAPVELLRDQLILHVQTQFIEYGTRVNSSSFETCLVNQTLRQGHVYRRLNQAARDRWRTQLTLLLKRPASLVLDVSHYAWAVELDSRETRPVESEYFDRFKELILAYPRRSGMLELNADLARASQTPALRSDDFLTAHTLLSGSRILQRHFDREVYEILRGSAIAFSSRFSSRQLWETRSYLIGGAIHSDVYLSALILRALMEFSKISPEAHRDGVVAISNLIVGPGEFHQPIRESSGSGEQDSSADNR